MTRRHPARSAHGAAALIVVLVLFFVVSLVAAYTSRGMIFEQRTSTNQLRSTQALEIGDAGIEWAITKLNAGLIDAACATDIAGASSFRQRYLTFAADGTITATPGLNATCVHNGADWVCSCPDPGSTLPAAGPGFRIYFEADRGGARANLIRVTVSACTEVSANCLANPQIPDPGKGNASVSASLGLKGALDTLPAAAITVPAAAAGDAALNVAGPQLAAYNGSQRGSGVAIHLGGVVAPVGALVTVGGPPGVPPEYAKVEDDASLRTGAGGALRTSTDAGACPAGDAHVGCSFNRVFAGFFGAPRGTYRQQPGLVRCDAGCNSAALQVLATQNPGSVILVAESAPGAADAVATLDGNLGSAVNPVALIVEGSVTLSGAGTVVTGFVYTTAGNWTVNGTPRIDGAIASEVPVVLGGGAGDRLEVRYDLPALSLLRSRSGSFVRVPGGWRDFPPPT